MLALVVLFCASNAGADWKSDCEQKYFKAIEECKSRFNDPNDPQCQACIAQAKADYKSCLHDASDEWDTER